MLLGFRSAAHAEAAGAVRGRAGAGHRRRLGGAPGARHRPAARGARRRPGRDGVRLRAAGDAGGGSGRLRRAGRAGPARARVRHGVRLRRLLRLRGPDPRRLRPPVRGRARARRELLAMPAGGSRPRPPWNVGQIQPGRSHRQTPVERRPAADDPAGRPLRRPARGPVLNGSGTFDAIAARRAFGDALLERFPFHAFVSKTITLAPREGNPPPRLWETPGRADQLDRAAQQGPRGLPRARPARAGRAAGAAGRVGDGLQPRRAGDARRARRASATRWR